LKEKQKSVWMPATIAGVALLLYLRTCWFGFTNWDDQSYLISNPYLRSISLANIMALLTPGSIRGELLFIPVTYFTHLIEGALFGLRPGVLHAANVFLHALNGVLVFFLLAGWTRCRLTAFFASMLFVVHPLQAESVAWAMGRKEVLSTALALGTFLLWRQSRRDDERARSFYLWSLLTFTLAVFAKPTVIVLPLLFGLVLLRNPKKFERQQLVAIGPYLLIAIVAYAMNRIGGEGGGMAVIHGLYLPSVLSDWMQRLFLIGRPSPLYPMGTALDPGQLGLAQWVPALLLIGLLVSAIRRRWRWVWFSLAFTAIAAIPAVTIVLAVDRQFITADRYGYLPLIGLFFLVARVRGALPKTWHRGWTVLIGIALVFCLVRSWQQISIWRNSETLWTHAVACDANVYQAHNSLGNHYADEGRLNDALAAYRKATEVRPDIVRPWYNKGIILERLLDLETAAESYRQAINVQPDYLPAHFNLAVLYKRMGDNAQAIAEFAEIVTIDPQHTEARYQMGVLLQQMRAYPVALQHFQALVEIDPTHVEGHFKVGMLHHRAGNFELAIAAYQRALSLDPNHETARHNMAVAWAEVEK
jgi:Flp pilus assembly protein TadD